MFADPAVASGTPKALFAGAITTVLVLVATLAEGYFWISASREALSGMSDSELESDGVRDAITGYTVIFIVLVTISLSLAATMLLGAGAALRGRHGGRIAIWVAGGIAIGWHVCCSLSVFFARLTITSAADQRDQNIVDTESLANSLPVWQIDAATICGFAAGILSIVAMVCVAQHRVNQHFRALRFGA